VCDRLDGESCLEGAVQIAREAAAAREYAPGTATRPQGIEFSHGASSWRSLWRQARPRTCP
jgi:hypothetical protein